MEYDLTTHEQQVLERLLEKNRVVNMSEKLFVNHFLDLLRHCREVGTSMHINLI